MKKVIGVEINCVNESMVVRLTFEDYSFYQFNGENLGSVDFHLDSGPFEEGNWIKYVNGSSGRKIKPADIKIT